MSEDKILYVPELARRLNRTEAAIRQAVLRESDSIPPGFKLGRRLAWKSSTVEKWLDKKNAKAERLLSR
ncbi:hypothetical protein [Methylocaldum sp.]|jgi:predicted DNA-binding transcriptional regulator AlpA|uniref:helix-turn-helix transcriptional regulator n=1 Tax=Methylocaldum sp. TaxID=1969727 RepID=UPI00321FE90A